MVTEDDPDRIIQQLLRKLARVDPQAALESMLAAHHSPVAETTFAVGEWYKKDATGMLAWLEEN
jgi:hypothetical protein